MGKSYFAILGVGSEASPEEIRSAYRRLAKQLHPDRTGGETGDAFRQVQEAYSVLIDDARRREYEQSHFEASGRGGWRRYTAPDPGMRRHRRAFTRPYSAFETLLNELFGSLGIDTSERRSARMPNYTLEVPLTRELFRRGGRLNIVVPAVAVCPACGGHGGLGRYACSRCLGQGAVAEEVPLSITLPPGMPSDETVTIALDRFGLPGTQLTIVLVDAE
jgi:molecular chaperone DnaJ